MDWRRQGNKPLSEPRMISLPMHICVTRPQWVNTLRPRHMGWDKIVAILHNLYMHYTRYLYRFCNVLVWSLLRKRKYPYFILSTLLILYTLYYCVYNVEIIRMQICFILNVFILAHNDSYGCFIICHVFYCILCCICIFYHVICQKWQNKCVKSVFSNALFVNTNWCILNQNSLKFWGSRWH